MTTFKIGGTYMNAPPFIMMETFWRKYFCVSIFLCYFADERNLELKSTQTIYQKSISKDMKRIVAIIFSVLVLTFIASCTDKGAMRERLDYVSQCNRADTVFTEAWLSTVDSLVNFFDRHGNANERMMAHYLKGRVHHDMGEAPIALECYQRATEMADTTRKDCDLRTLAAIYGQMADLFHLQYLPDDEMSAIKMAESLDWKNNDTLAAIMAHQLRTRPYYLRNEQDSVLSVTKRSIELFKLYGRKDIADQTLMILISVYFDKKQYDKAWRVLNDFENSQAFINGDNKYGKGHYNYYKGYSLLQQGRSDSAIVFFRKAIDRRLYEAGYKGLLSAYEKKNIPDSIAKYARLYANSNDSSYLHVNQERVHQVSAIYNYNRQRQLATQKEQEAGKLRNTLYALLGICILSALGVYRWWDVRKRKTLSELAETNEKYAETIKQYNHLRLALELSNKDHEQYRLSQERELEKLRETLSAYQDDKSRPEKWDIESTVLASSIVERFHNLASKITVPSEDEWEVLQKLLQGNLPSFYEHINDERHSLTDNEKKASMLIRLRFIPSEIVVLLGLSKQRISNIRRDINRKLFHAEGTKMLDAHIRRL